MNTRVNIKLNDMITHSASFSSEEEANQWVTKQELREKPWSHEKGSYVVEYVNIDAEIALKEVYANRKAEYGQMSDQLDEIFHNGIDSWKARIQAIKDKYPKPL